MIASDMQRRRCAGVVGLCLVLGAIAVGHADERKPYTLGDLKALAKQQGWSELVDHLEDVAPTNRDAEWRSLAQQAGLGVLGIAGRNGPAEGLAIGDALLARYSVLKDSKDFMAQRAKLGYAAFERCFRKLKWADACGERIAPFVEADPSNVELAFRVAKLIPAPAHHAYAAPAFAIALQKKDDARCKDDDVRYAVVAGLGLAADSNDDVVAASVKLASTVCWTALRDPVLDAMGRDEPDYLKNACPLLRAKQALSALLTKRCDAVTKPN